MLMAEAGCVFVCLVLYMSGVTGQQNSICALKGSSVDLPCSAERHTVNVKWFTVHYNQFGPFLRELSADGSHGKYKMLEEKNFTLTISDLNKKDENVYCCGESTDSPEDCKKSEIHLQVADLQVKVIPTSEGQTVTLMCSSSCPLTEKPAAYIWYKNGEFLYQDWSPWYQQLVRSQEAVTYSCAIKGYEHLRAPEVSVDSVTSSCFSVTYAKGRMCSYQQTSEDEPCSITFPKEVHLQKSPEAPSGHVILICNTSCDLTDRLTVPTWYENRLLQRRYEKQQIKLTNSSHEGFSCAVKGFEDLHSNEVCLDDGNCLSVNYVNRRICALETSSVIISANYSYPRYLQPQSKVWYKIKRTRKEGAQKMTEDGGRVEYHDGMKKYTLRIKQLKKSDSAEYTFRLQEDEEGWKQSDLPGVTLLVTGLEVKLSPSAVVTEGQRVSLTCSTSCPLSDNTSYIWYFNGGPLTLPQNQSKVLLLDPVSSQRAGNYSCAVETYNISSSAKTLTVLSTMGTWTPAAAAGGVAALLVLILVTVFLWIRRKRTSRQTAGTETSDNSEQLNPGHTYEEISAQPAKEDAVLYEELSHPQKHTDPLYNMVQPHQSQDQDRIEYSVITFGEDTT